MTAPFDEIEHLKARIAEAEAQVAALEAEVIDLRRELEAFTARYDRLIRPAAERLEVLRAVVADLEREKLTPPQLRGFEAAAGAGWTPPPDYVPVAEQYWRTWVAPRHTRREEPEPVTRLTLLDDDPDRMLKRLYRALVKRYHPDLTADPAERARRNRLMAEINAAYARQDLDALHALSLQPPDAVPDVPLAALELRQLRLILAQLERRVRDLEAERHAVLHSDLLWLSIEAKLAAREGRDLLREMLADIEREYAACLDRVDELRAL